MREIIIAREEVSFQAVLKSKTGWRNGVYVHEIDLESGRSMSTGELICYSNVGNGIAEGSHIFKRGRYYYLIAAIGGTEVMHQEWVYQSTIGARGPWECGPENKPHIDGAWPAAGIDSVTGEYLHDSSPPDDPLWSRYTLLSYLNSDINASSTECKVPGSTTFFLPSPSSIGNLLTCPIAPVQGAVLVFPHGDASGSLLHEGSPVGDGGSKVVIRTDLLYEAEGFGEFAPGKKRKIVTEDTCGVNKMAKVV